MPRPNPFERSVSGGQWSRFYSKEVDDYDKPWLTDVTVGECQHAGSLADAGVTQRPMGHGKVMPYGNDLPPPMGHNYQYGKHGQTEWRCQKCGVLWETNRADPQWCRG